MPLSPSQFGGIHRKLETDGGFTVSAKSGRPITSGISVAPRENEQRVDVASSTPQVLADYHAANADRFSRGAALGGWRSPEGQDVLDTPTVYPNNPGGETRARQQMVLAGQEAAFKLDDFEEVPNPFHPVTRNVMGLGQHEIADIAGRGREGSEFAARQPEVQAWINSPRERAKLGSRSSGR